MHENLTTHFAPPERADASTVCRQAEAVRNSTAARLADAMPYMMLMLNRQRQVIFANSAVLSTVGAARMDDLLGKRPGEMLDCVHACHMQAGCGTSPFCSQCGAAKAILSSLSGNHSVEQCRMLRTTGVGVQGINLEVSAAPLDVSGEPVTAFTALDVSRDVRRKSMERLFFHDVLNLAGGLDGALQGFSRRLKNGDKRMAEIMAFTARSLVEEISAHKALTAAENGELVVRPETMLTGQFVESLTGLYALHGVARKRTIRLAEDCADIQIVTDPTLLSRVLGNLIKNALEASPEGGVVTVGCGQQGQEVLLRVHNPGCMDKAVQLQVFNPSYSTKGEGRGLGTYSIKLFTESFLDGRVSFTSSSKRGTEFTVALPLDISRTA